MDLKRLLGIALLVMATPAPSIAVAAAATYRVVEITDGDTFVATDGTISFRVRIAAMDAPEKAQEYGKRAKIELENLLAGKTVAIAPLPVRHGLDPYHRVLGRVTVDGKDVALAMIAAGLATYYRPQCRDYPQDQHKYHYDPRPFIAAEEEARAAKRNMWSLKNVELPCDFRHTTRKR